MTESLTEPGSMIDTLERPLIVPLKAPKQRTARPWLIFLVVGVGISWLYPLMPRKGVAQSVIATLLPIAAIAAVLVGVRIHRPRRKVAWYLLAAAQTSWAVAVVIWFPIENHFGAHLGFPSVIDLLILGAYPAFVLGLAILIRSRSRRDRAKFVDTSIVSVAISLLFWIFLISPTASASGLSLLGRATSVAYPIMDILLIVCVTRFVFNGRAPSPAIVLLIAFFGTLLVGDLALSAGELISHGRYETGGVFDTFWWSSFALLGAAALHPSMNKAIDADRAPASSWSRVHLYLLALAAMVSPGALLVLEALGRTNRLGETVIAGTAVVMFLLVLVRMHSLISDLRMAETERQRLVSQVMRGAEAERSRIAYELHDAPIQRLAALSLRLAAMSRRIRKGSQEQANSLLEEMQMALSTEIDGLRRMMVGLRPPSLDQAGLRMAVEDQIEEFHKDCGATCTVDIELSHPLSSDLETTIFRVIQEALRNAANHSGCSQASVAVRNVGKRIEMTVHDDGSGFLPDGLDEHPGFGLASMREHVQISKGEFEVMSSPGRGTWIKAVFALDGDRR